MANTVIGFFDDAEDAQNAVEELTEAGFDRSRIDVSSGRSESNTTSSSAADTSASYNTNSDSTASNAGEHTGSAIARFFHSLFGDDKDEATRYSRVAQTGKVIVTVHANSSDEAEDAADILDEAGAIDVNEHAASYGYNDDGATSTSSDRSSATGNNLRSVPENKSNDNKIDRVEEELQVGKRSVETGGVRVRSRIVERPVEENLRLKEEHVTVDRVPVNRAISADDYSAFEEQNIELTERAEVPVVNKEARVVEEIRVGKNETERDETIRDTVRKTEVDIENLKGENTGTGSTDSWKSTERDSDDSRL